MSAVAGSDAGDCNDAVHPCLTIAYAISQSQPYNTIHVAAGTYTPPTAPVISLEGLQIIGDPANKPVLGRLGGLINQQLLVINGAKNVHVENLDFHMDQSFVAEGLLANGMVDGLTIVNNHFVQSSTNASAVSKYTWRNAISINDDSGNSASLGIAPGSSVSITGNVIDGAPNVSGGVFQRIGINMDNGLGVISGNTITAGVHDIRVRFSTKTVDSSVSTTTINGNTLSGRGLELDAPNAGVGAITISNNHINAAAGASGSIAYPADWALVRLIDNQQTIATTLSGNTFQGHTGSYRGVLIENFPAVQLTGNFFTPASGATDFVSLVVSNKEVNTGNANAPYAMSISAQGNTFNGSGVPNAGRAVEFLNDNDNSGSAVFNSLVFGGSGASDPNTFDGNLRWYFHLDDYSCDTVSTPCTFLDYNGAIGNDPATNTQVRPFRGNVSAAQNVFAGAPPSSATLNALQARTYDKNANPALGSVDYGLSGTTPIVYVGASFAGSGYGDAKSFVSSAPACGSQTVYFGINAFATIPDGIMHVQLGGTVCVAKGAYAASVTIAKPLQLIGDGNGAADTVIGAQLSITAGGSAAASPLLVQNLRVANPAAGGNGIVVSSFVAGAPIAHLHFDAVSSIGNRSYGLALDVGAPGSANAPGIDEVAISNSHFNNNGNFGMMAGRYSVVSNVVISGSTFQGNEIGGAGFFETGNVGTGQISHWSVSGSQFTSNAPDDTSAGGGGLWLKTGGPGSSISSVSVIGSTFADNGSGGTYNGRFMNRVGIHVRARAGTTLAGINICNNTFSETATPGTQETGIYVFDQTGNTGYEPITVCASNDFSTLAHSVSGYEQSQTSGGASQPVVNITGGTIANTEYINGFVTRIHSGVQNGAFPSITAAMSDANTVAGDEIHAPAGVYHEKVTITHDGIKLSGDGASTIIDGAGLNGNGIDASARQNVTITSLAVQNFDIASSEGACIYTSGGSNGLTVTNTVISECRNGRGGIYVNAIGDVDNVTLSDNDISNSDDRGIVVWNGAKSHITINGNTIHDITGSAGIGLQDGTASDVTISGNTLTDTGDSGIFALGLSSGTITNNQVNIAGRYGIQLLNPAGADATSITVQGNTVNLTALPALINDIAGISVARRYVSAGGADNPSGVTISGNTVHGWQSNAARPGYDGFGIAIEGTAISVSGNTLDSNDIGVQLQAGNAGYPGDSDQSLVNDFFSRGDAKTTCADLGTNAFIANGLDSRSVTAVPGQSIKVSAHNTARGTRFCAIQGAIDAASTVAGDTITVDAGAFGENVIVNKSILLKGPKATFAGYDSSRGSGEAIINPSSGRPLFVTANGATVDGFTFDGATRDQTVVTNTAAAGDLQFINNRITNVFGAAGILTAQGTQSWTIARNLFKDFTNDTTSPIRYAQAIKYLGANGGLIEDNEFVHVQSNAMQVEQNTGSIQVLRNHVDGQTAYYTNTGLQLDGNAGATVLARDNTFTNTQNGLLIDNGSSTTTTVCNTVTNSKYGLLVLSFPSLGSEDAGRVFDNALSGDTSDVSSGWSANTLVLGSNFYDGAAPSTAGSAALIAGPLPASPIGQAACGDNTPTGLVAVAGTPQTAAINTAFAQPLVARVVDALGGAVMGQSVAFSAPASGASATLSPTSGTSDYDGRVSTNAMANAVSGGYNVVATSSSGSALFALTNAGQPSVALTLNGPSTVVAGTPTPGYTAQLSNTGSTLPENVLVNFVLSRAGGLGTGDVVLEYNTGSGFAAIPLSPCGANLCGSFGPPAGFAVGAGYNSTTQLRFTSNRSGAVDLIATVDGVDSHTAYATSSITVTVSATAQNIAPNGPTTFSGTAGAALAPPLPSVIVTDALGNPAPGVVVTFAAQANSGTLTGAVQTTDANGIATLGGWVLDATPGTNTVTANAAGVTGSVAFTAEGTAAAGALQVTITDNRDYVQFDHPLTVIATIGNSGDSDMSAVTVADVLPPELDVGSQGWQCIAFNGATCAANATRDLNVTVSLPAHSSVMYLLNATVNRNGSDLITNTITATSSTSPADTVTATDTTEIVIFRDGFEDGGDGAEAVLPALDGANAAALDTTGRVALDVTADALSSLRVTTVAQAEDGTFRVEAIRVGTALWLRLVAHDASADTFSPWSEMGKGGAMLALGNSGTRLILVGTAQDLDVALAKAGPFTLRHAAH